MSLKLPLPRRGVSPVRRFAAEPRLTNYSLSNWILEFK
jgi:hypothetical protein